MNVHEPFMNGPRPRGALCLCPFRPPPRTAAAVSAAQAAAHAAAHAADQARHGSGGSGARDTASRGASYSHTRTATATNRQAPPPAACAAAAEPTELSVARSVGWAGDTPCC